MGRLIPANTPAPRLALSPLGAAAKKNNGSRKEKKEIKKEREKDRKKDRKK